MMNYHKVLLTVSLVIVSFIAVAGVELTFELPESERQCFYENIPQNATATLEFQVVTGGQYDVDVSLEAPNREIIYKQIKKQFDTYSFVPKIPGIYEACFSNEFSTFSHKIIYMDFQIEMQIMPPLSEHLTLMTQMESSAEQIHKRLSTVHDYQTHHRLKEAKGRKRAEELNEHVLWWSILEIIVILISAIGQVFIVVRDFSSEKKMIQVNDRMTPWREHWLEEEFNYTVILENEDC